MTSSQQTLSLDESVRGCSDGGPKRTELALHQEASQGGDRSVQKLLEPLEDPNVADIWSLTPLQRAVLNGHEISVRSLLDNGAKINLSTDLYPSPLEISARHGHAEIVRILLERGAGALEAAVHEAARGGHEVVVDMLIKAGASLRFEGPSGYILHIAARSGNVDALRQVLQAGGGDLSTALVAAFEKGYSAIACRLIECGADVNAAVEQCGTELHKASARGNHNLVRLLLGNGVSPSTSFAPITGNALHSAVDDCWGKFVEDSYDPLLERMCVMDDGHLAVVKLLTDKDIDLLHQKDFRGQTPLHTALARDKPDGEASQDMVRRIVKLLLEKGASVDAVNRSRDTPLFAATKSAQFSAIELLLRHGANINHQNMHGLTPLWWAVSFEHVELVSFYLVKGADPAISNNEGISPLALAKRRGNNKASRDILKLLDDHEAQRIRKQEGLPWPFFDDPYHEVYGDRLPLIPVPPVPIPSRSTGDGIQLTNEPINAGQ
jgi:ankyrin repeat protein